MRAPAFWELGSGRLAPWLLAPAAWLVAAATARRTARPGWRAPVPVICCGNAGAGGSGKTTVALDIGARLRARGVAVAFLTRGYGGSARGPLLVSPDHPAALVGDEAKLLAEQAPTYVCADRAVAARAALADGAEVLVMDDGLQNPKLAKTLSLLVVDGAAGFGNGRVIPAGPLREPAAVAAARCAAVVLIGADPTGALRLLPALPVLRCRLVSAATAGSLGGPALAFAGIGRPQKFFDTLAEAGVVLAGCRPFADHHRYSEREVQSLLREATRLGAVAVTTPKDAVRLPPALLERIRVVGVRLVWDDTAALDRLLDVVMPQTHDAT